ncbi:predicted protein [Postia placenta Mad-698-R]|nr:predicted protein [Postia placenta Mad-698-R]
MCASGKHTPTSKAHEAHPHEQGSGSTTSRARLMQVESSGQCRMCASGTHTLTSKAHEAQPHGQGSWPRFGGSIKGSMLPDEQKATAGVLVLPDGIRVLWQMGHRW